MNRPPSFWDERYAEPGYAYGTEPNDFVREMAERIPPGRVLCLADGQGRNAVFLAGRGFDVTAMDQSGVGLGCAQALARERGVGIVTARDDLETFAIEPGVWQGIVSVFVHVPRELREHVHERVVRGLAPGGVYVFEGFTPAQLDFATGGPQELERFATLAELEAELSGLAFEIGREVEREVLEGRYHTGRSATVQVLARRPGE